MENASVVYLNVSVERVNMPRDERAVIWVRAEIAKDMLRIPPLPPVWITGKGESLPPQSKADGNLQDDASGHLVTQPESRLDNGHAENGQSGPVTSPLPKKTIDYQLPAGISLDEAQGLLARKLEEARVIIRELEKRSWLRLTLNRNFQIVVDLSGR